jgi:secreted trypsin-like serine protease
MRKVLQRQGRNRRIIAASAILAGTLIATSASPSSAIVGGSPTSVTDLPWQVALEDADGQFCGGAIIGLRTIVTAAHCTEGYTARDIQVRAGVTDLREAGGQTLGVERIDAHPEYVRSGLADIAVLHLAQDLTFGETARPISLASSPEVAAASSAIVAGWGAVSEDGADSPRLLSVEEPLVDDAVCDALVRGIYGPGELCAGAAGLDSCYGDSGGPLVIRDSVGVPKLAGIVSWGEVCGGDTPGVYTEVPAYVGWIASVTGGAISFDDATTGSPTAPVDPGSDLSSSGAADRPAGSEAPGIADGSEGEWENEWAGEWENEWAGEWEYECRAG